jgi:hypothetical protein
LFSWHYIEHDKIAEHTEKKFIQTHYAEECRDHAHYKTLRRKISDYDKEAIWHHAQRDALELAKELSKTNIVIIDSPDWRKVDNHSGHLIRILVYAPLPTLIERNTEPTRVLQRSSVSHEYAEQFIIETFKKLYSTQVPDNSAIKPIDEYPAQTAQLMLDIIPTQSRPIHLYPRAKYDLIINTYTGSTDYHAQALKHYIDGL